jgi:triosephosphate isomerase
MSERTDLIVGNWKMNATHLEAIQMVQKLSYRLEPADYERVEVVVGPPFTAIRSVQTVIEADHMLIKIAAQNVHWEAKGAYTGEIAPEMLSKLSVSHVIIGHSERRAMFGETDEIVNKKAKAVLASGMTPIMCVGESLEEREAGRTEQLVVGQVEAGFKGLASEDVARSAIAYEPIWAIGTGRTAEVDDAGSVAELIRSTVARTHGDDAAESMRLLYGGSMNAGNVKGFMAKRHIDGGLVGGASLDPDSFAAIVRYWV